MILDFLDGTIVQVSVPPKNNRPITGSRCRNSKKKGHVVVAWHGQLIVKFVNGQIRPDYGRNFRSWPMENLFKRLKRDFDRHNVCPVDGLSAVCHSGLVPRSGAERGQNAAAALADFFHIPVRAPTGLAQYSIGGMLKVIPDSKNIVSNPKWVTVSPKR